MKLKNVNTGAVLSEKEYESLLIREYKEMWENDSDIQVMDFKEEGKSFEEYKNYMLENEIDSDFVVVEE